MWLFTKHGFFSVVCARQGDGRQGEPIDTTRLMVRARVRAHLEALKKRCPDHLGPCDIRTSAGTDYAFRMFVDKPAWSRVASELALETDYDNFKSEVARYQGRAGDRYERSLHDVWSVMHRLQDWPRGEAEHSRSAAPAVRAREGGEGQDDGDSSMKPGTLKEEPSRYFIIDEKTEMVPISQLRTTPVGPEDIARAEPLMKKAYGRRRREAQTDRPREA